MGRLGPSSVVTALLFSAPLLVRVGLVDLPSAVDVLLSLLPLIVVLPSSNYPFYVRDEEAEHVIRHATYAFAFSLSPLAVRWEEVDLDAGWGRGLVAYFAVGGLSLWWFVVSHLVENQADHRVHTHQGDVAVLPLTLVAIATFAEEVPDEAYRFSRSVVFFVPVVVAWATLHFVAMTGFATSRTTTHSVEGFSEAAFAGLVVASAHLSLLEMRAPPVSFAAFAFVAALLCQVSARPVDPPRLRGGSFLGRLLLLAGTGAGAGAVLRHGLSDTTDGLAPVLLPAVVGLLVPSLAAPRLAGGLWVVPAAAYATLLVASFWHADGIPLDPSDVVAAGATLFVAAQLTEYVAPAAARCVTPPSFTPSTASAAVQVPTLIAAVNAFFSAIPWPTYTRVDDALFASLMSARHPSCPDEFAGVWWLEGTPFPYIVNVVHDRVWRETVADDGSTIVAAVCNYGHGVVRPATLAGFLANWLVAMWEMRIEFTPGRRWVPTPAWFFTGLHLLPHCYFMYRADEHTIFRSFSSGPAYRILRVVGPRGERTSHYAAFMAIHGGKPCIAPYFAPGCRRREADQK